MTRVLPPLAEGPACALRKLPLPRPSLRLGGRLLRCPREPRAAAPLHLRSEHQHLLSSSSDLPSQLRPGVPDEPASRPSLFQRA